MAPQIQTLPQNYSRLPISPSTNSTSRHPLSPKAPSPSDGVTSACHDPNLKSGDPDSVIFSVLCMFDFTSREAGILSFRKYEILDIVKCTGGWWAAMRKGGSTLGWIPQTFVNPLSEEMAERLRGIREELRGAEFKRVKGLHYSTQDTSLLVDDSVPPSPIHESKNLATDSSSSSWSARPEEFLDIRKEQNIVDLPQSLSRLSPTTPTHDLTRSASAQINSPSRSLLPRADDSRMRSGSLPIAIHRRHPVIVDDDVTLSRISTLIKSTNAKQTDKLPTTSRETPASFRVTSNVVHKQLQEDKLQRKLSESGGVSFTALSNVVNKQIQKDKGKVVESGGPIINIGPPQPQGTPRYLRSRHADELEIDNKGNVRSGSLLSLFEMLTTSPGTSCHTKLHQGGELAQFKTFTNVFLMTFRTFTTADQLFDMLVERFHLKPEKSLTEYEYIDWKTNFRNPVQHVVLDVFSTWLEDYQLLEEEPHIAQRLKDFLTLIVYPPHNTTATTIIQTIDHLTSINPILVASSLTPKKGRKLKVNKLDLFKLDPKTIAEQLAVYEFGLYIKITPQQCLTYTKSHTGDGVAKLRDFCNFCSTHDKLSAWVKMSILNSDATGRRALTVDFWIKVAERCRMLNNISSMSAIITALSSTTITELHLTWAHTSRKPVLDGLLRYSQPTGGFAGYRSLLQQAAGPCVPFITMFLTEMAHVQDQFTETEGRIYFYQRVRWYETISAMLRFQSRPYDIAADESIISFIEGHLREGSCCDPGWFWKRSQEVQKAEVTHADIRKGLEAAGF